MEGHRELARGVVNELHGIPRRLVNPREDHRARPFIPDGDRIREDPAQRCASDAEVERRQWLGERRGAQEERLALLHDALGKSLGTERLAVDRAPVGRHPLYRDEAVRVVEQEDHAHLRVGQPDQRLQTHRGERPDVECLELPYELGIGACARVPEREVLVGPRELGHGPFTLGERRPQARVLLEQERVHLHQAERDRAELVPPDGHRRERLEAAGRGQRLFDLRRGARDVARDPRPADERDRDGEQQHRARRPLRVVRRLEGGLFAGVGLVERVLAEVAQDAAHLVGQRLALVGHVRVRHLALARSDLGLADVLDPLADEAPEGRHALVLHSVLGDGLSLGEQALELPPRLLVGREEAPVVRQEVAALARLQVDHQAQQLLRVVGELQVVLHEALELLLELLVRGVGAVEAPAEHEDDEERAEENSPEESAAEDSHVAAGESLVHRRPGRITLGSKWPEPIRRSEVPELRGRSLAPCRRPRCAGGRSRRRRASCRSSSPARSR